MPDQTYPTDAPDAEDRIQTWMQGAQICDLHASIARTQGRHEVAAWEASRAAELRRLAYGAILDLQTELEPRAVAALVSVRRAPRTVRELADAIGDHDLHATLSIVAELTASKYLAVASDGVEIVEVRPGPAGIDWLRARGLT